MELTEAVEAGISTLNSAIVKLIFPLIRKGLMYSLDILGDWLYEKEILAQVQQLTVLKN